VEDGVLIGVVKDFYGDIDAFKDFYGDVAITKVSMWRLSRQSCLKKIG
jgi:hypothetical protein